MLELSLTAAFLVGLFGGGHCVGMCGGIVGAVTISLPNSKPGNSQKLPYLLAYNLGRISSYVLAGAIAGAVGASSFFLANVLPVAKLLYALASLMLILLGLYLSGISVAVTHFEALGQRIWLRIQPYGKRFIPVKRPLHAYALGTVWGWLPCGMVYSILIAAIATASPAKGAILMLSFGLGTLPSLLAMGLAALKIKAWLQRPWVRRISGLVILAFGAIGLINLWMSA